MRDCVSQQHVVCGHQNLDLQDRESAGATISRSNRRKCFFEFPRAGAEWGQRCGGGQMRANSESARSPVSGHSRQHAQLPSASGRRIQVLLQQGLTHATRSEIPAPLPCAEVTPLCRWWLPQEVRAMPHASAPSAYRPEAGPGGQDLTSTRVQLPSAPQTHHIQQG